MRPEDELLSILSKRRAHADLLSGEFYNCGAERMREFWARIGETAESVAAMNARAKSFCNAVGECLGEVIYQQAQDAGYAYCLSLAGQRHSWPNLMTSWELATVNGEAEIDPALLQRVVALSKEHGLCYVPQEILDAEVREAGFELSCRHLLFDCL